MSFKSAVITFPGSNCDRDALTYLRDLTQGEVLNIWHEESSLPKVDLVILPGGFSFGDYLRSGAMASKSNIIHDVIDHANNGRYLLGICNGFQILTEIGLLKGALIQNESIKFLGKDCHIKKNSIINLIAILKIMKCYRSQLPIMKGTFIAIKKH